MSEKYIYIKVKVKDLNDSDLSKGDYIEWNGEVFKFLGWEYGTYPIAENLETGETITLPHF